MQALRKWCSDERLFPTPYDFSFGSPQDLENNKLLFESNYIKTSKYTWYNFLPKSLLLQFRRVANIYFLIIGVLQSIPSISPLGPLTAWAPLIVVLGISLIRQGYEDYQRYLSDNNYNFELKTHVVRAGKLVEVSWSEVVMGDICYVTEEERFPVDLILISSSSNDGNSFIETASLDGQKNLKPRCAYSSTQKYCTLETISQFKGKWEGIIPDRQLHEFKSTLKTNDQRIDYSRDKQLLYRQSVLKNTKWIYGLSIYTGRNSKILMNSQGESSKMSQIESKVNIILSFILLLQFVLSLITAILNYVFTLYNRDEKTDYIIWGTNFYGLDAVLIFFSYFVLINTMIPISLIVSIEVVKVSQSYFMNKDKLAFSEERQRGMLVKSSSLNEQLGQIQYVFTDKTGTLTKNLMEFKLAMIGQRLYGDIGLIDDQTPIQKSKGFHDDELAHLLSKGTKNQTIKSIVVSSRQKKITKEITSIKELAQEYMTALAIAHEVVVATDKEGVVKYQGPSPDEIALVDTAKAMKYEFLKSTPSSISININDTQTTFELLQSFGFTSQRKRMSVIIREKRQKNVIKMYIKGADNIIKERLASDQVLNIDNELNTFAKVGLRTLIIAMRYISEEEYALYKKRVRALPLEEKEDKMQKEVDKLQSNLYIIGATAVLDRLQDQVSQTIRDLIRANIKVWMLTGDKLQTAENIAKSCNLIQRNFKVLTYVGRNKQTGKSKKVQQLQQHLSDLTKQAKEFNTKGTPVSLLIQGPELTPIVQNDTLEQKLADLSVYCESVVCCRLQPAQKADVVRIVRQRLNKITLSIGDGANDVPMIKMAHIGIGLYGEEGMGAVMASDYALPEFRMLWRLILVHGRWNYTRIAEMILYFFYKNMLFTIPQFISAFYCGFSGQTIFDDYYIALFNLIFTSLPLVIRAIFEQDVNYIQQKREVVEHIDSAADIGLPKYTLETLNKKYLPKNYEVNKYIYRLFPKMYFIGQESCIFNYRNFFFWVLQAMAESLIISLFCIYIISEESINESGRSTDMWIAGITMYTTIMFVITFKLATHTKFWSTMLFLSIIILSLGIYLIYLYISRYSLLSAYVEGTSVMFYSSGQTYFIIIFCVCLVLFIDGIVLSFDSNELGVINKVRNLIAMQKERNASEYQKESIKITNFTQLNVSQRQ